MTVEMWFIASSSCRGTLETGSIIYERKNISEKKHDARHDVLHVYLNNRCSYRYASADEEYPDIYVLRDDDTDEIVGF